ncbi:RICIN domain-containing protein, partial [Streptomyces sp. NPDC018352]|uniref:RICIN domain-containing protein n=1 Tax=Streptomyces sp. NPDC018352 TaxID=3157194 RepID=UPI0033D17B18
CSTDTASSADSSPGRASLSIDRTDPNTPKSVVVSLAVYAGTQLRGDQNDHKGTADGRPDQTSTLMPSTGGSASPSRSPRATASAGTSAGATPPQAVGGGSTDGGSSLNGGGVGGNTTDGNTTGGKPTGGSGDAGGSGGSNGSSSSSGVSGATSPTPPASSGHFRLRDVGYGKCLAVKVNVVFATCEDSPATNWTAKAGSGGSYMLYNESASQCLSVSFKQMYMADCGSTATQSWRTGTSSTIVHLDSSLCLDQIAGGPVLTYCKPSKSTQHWAKE